MSLNQEGFFGNSFLLFWFALGMFVCVLWITSSMRLQLKLKLRYFQARYLERKMDSAGENFCSDEGIFFNPEIRKIESPDKKELLQYPVKGLSRMDGFIGAAKSRYLNWILPSIFFFFYLVTWIYFLLGYLRWNESSFFYSSIPTNKSLGFCLSDQSLEPWTLTLIKSGPG